MGVAPDLVSLRATKPAGQNTRFFIDFLCLRQLMSDFNLTRVLEAIKVIAITVIELGADWRAAEAWLHRLFCVVEGFATVNAKGKLLLVGPALQEHEKVMELLEVATDKTRCLEMMDCGDAEKTKCFFEADTATIREYIESSVGFVKTDKQVLSGVASGCMDRVLSVMEKDKKQQERAAEMAHGIADMLFEAEVRMCVFGWGGRVGLRVHALCLAACASVSRNRVRVTSACNKRTCMRSSRNREVNRFSYLLIITVDKGNQGNDLSVAICLNSMSLQIKCGSRSS